jgi:hypothetical protein
VLAPACPASSRRHPMPASTWQVGRSTTLPSSPEARGRRACEGLRLRHSDRCMTAAPLRRLKRNRPVVVLYSQHDLHHERARSRPACGRSRAPGRMQRCTGRPGTLAAGSCACAGAAGGARRVRRHQGNHGHRASDLGAGRVQWTRNWGRALGNGFAARCPRIPVRDAARGRGSTAGRQLEQDPVGNQRSFAGPDDRGPAARPLAAGCHHPRPDCLRQPASKSGGRAHAGLLVVRGLVGQRLTTDQHDRPGRAAGWNAARPTVVYSGREHQLA